MEQPILEPTAPETPAPEQKQSSGFWRFLLDVLETLILSALLFWGIDKVSARIRVDGYSMEPSLHNGEFIIVNRLAYTLGKPERGDVIVFLYPRDPTQEYIKRVIGLAGDRVRVASGEVYVNDQLLNEPYIAAAPRYQSEWTVPENSLFVLGDNRNNSSDSHNWGPVPMEDVIGRAILVYWPPKSWGVVTHMASAILSP
jgi:signal peptidase I